MTVKSIVMTGIRKNCHRFIKKYIKSKPLMKEKKIDCNSAREICMIDLLHNLGYRSEKENEKDAWYRSPFRNETVPSFKISKKLNRWFDHGEGIGGNTLDFIIRLKNCSVKEALIYLSEDSFSFHQQQYFKEEPTSNFELIKKQNLQNQALINYLESRKISYEIARLYCFEIYYKSNGKRYFSIVFQNDSGGIELRNKYFKGSCNKKHITTIKNGSDTLNIFEGFFDFLSYLTLYPNRTNEDFIIINSTSLVEKSIKYLEDYDIIRTFFDNDSSGKNATKLIEHSCQNKLRNQSLKFKGYKDLNDYLLSIN
jgi:DNA primase